MIRWRDPFSQAGWLFADLLLALWVLSSVTGVLPQRRATPTPSPTPSEVARTAAPTTPAPTASQDAVAVASVCRTFMVSLDGLLSPATSPQYADAKARAITEMTTGLIDLKGRRVSLALTFATAASTTRAGDLAKAVNALVKGSELDTNLDGLFRVAQTRDYIFEKADPAAQGQVYLEMFLPPPLPADIKRDPGCPR